MIMDLEAYIGGYIEETKLLRLFHIGRCAQDPAIAAQAYRLALQEIQANGNTNRYKELFDTSNHSRQHSLSFDNNWISETEDSNRSLRHVLESRLSAAQSHLNKDAIRHAYLELAKFDRKRSEWNLSLRSVLRSRDYCTSLYQTGQVCVEVLELSLFLQDYNQVQEYVLKAERTLGYNNNENNNNNNNNAAAAASALSSKLKLARGLTQLHHGDYQAAAKTFARLAAGRGFAATVEAAASWPAIVGPEDVALYAGILSLATSSRDEIIALSGPPMEQGALGEELLPPMRQALYHFGRAEYQACLKQVQSLQERLQWDIYLYPHVNVLWESIRDKCLWEHLKPYQRISLTSMAEHFEMEPMQLQLLLAEKWSRLGVGGNDNHNTNTTPQQKGGGKGSNDASKSKTSLSDSANTVLRRMDCRTMTMTRQDIPMELTAQNKLNRVGRRVLDDGYAMIVRLACLEHDLMVTDSKKGGGGGKSRGGGRRTMAADYEVVEDSSEDDDEMQGPPPAVPDGDMPMTDVGDHPANPEDLY